MTTPYKPITWGPLEPIFKDKLNQMTNNDQWLFENTPRMFYNWNVKKTSGVKLAAGVARIGASKSHVGQTTIYFGNYFSPGCRPIITTGLLTPKATRYHIAFRGIGSLFPDHRGFTVIAAANLAVQVNRIESTIYIPWHAVGY